MVDPALAQHTILEPGALFSYAIEGPRGLQVLEELWLVVEAGVHNHRGTGPTQSITAINERGRISHTYLYASDRIVVHCG